MGKEETAMATGALTAVAALYQDTEFTETGSAIIAKNIKKTFTDLSLSCLHYIHYKEKFFSAASLMLNGATLKQISDSLNINIATAFAWRHKILDILKNRQDKKLSGIVEADDTFFAISDKGNKNLKRKAKKEGQNLTKEELALKRCVLL